MAFPYDGIRPRNVVMLFKAETTEGTDASPSASDAFPFEAEGWSYNAPYSTEESDEATGSLVSGAPLVIGQPAVVTVRFRLKGAGAGSTYSASVKPPHHALLQSCGWRGLFSSAIAAAVITAGSTTSATLGTGFGTTAQAIRGLPLQLASGNSSGRLVHVTDYTSGKVATLTDLFGASLNTSVTAALPANWSYAATSPASSATRATDHPSGTLYIYEDGRLLKFVGMRGQLTLEGETARPGFASVRLMGIFAGETAASVPAVTVPQHSAPVLAMGDGGVTPALLVNRIELAVKRWSLTGPSAMEVTDDPNTAYGFGAPDLDVRAPTLEMDPLTTAKANIDRWNEIMLGSTMTAVIRTIGAAGNRWSLCAPLCGPVMADPEKRGIFRTDGLKLRAYNPGLDPSTRDNDLVLTFY